MRYEPTAAEINTLKGALKEFAVQLFDSLHANNPQAFLSVTPEIDRVTVLAGERYPLRVDVTFVLLYNEAPENAPKPQEIEVILQDAYTSKEFIYFYLYGNNDIWSNVSSVQVVARPSESGSGSEPSTSPGPNVDVYATMLYDFAADPSRPPTENDYADLTLETKKFYKDVLTAVYRDNPLIMFNDIIVTQEAQTYDINATPPVVIDFKFEVQFAPSSQTFPSSSALFDIMAKGDQQNYFDNYIQVYLQQSGSYWSDVDRVGFLESVQDQTTHPMMAGILPSIPPVMVGIPPSVYTVESSMIYSFFPTTASRPTKNNYDKLGTATNTFFVKTLTNAFQNRSEAGFETASSTVDGSFYSEGLPEPVQVDFSIQVTFEGTGPNSQQELFDILQGGNYTDYIMNYLWPEGAPWNNVNGVMFTERMPPPPPTTAPPVTTALGTLPPATGSSVQSRPPAATPPPS